MATYKTLVVSVVVFAAFSWTVRGAPLGECKKPQKQLNMPSFISNLGEQAKKIFGKASNYDKTESVTEAMILDKTGTLNLIVCTACKAMVTDLQDNVESGDSPEETMATLARTCVDFQIETEEVCNGVLEEFKDPVYYIITKLKTNVDEVCTTIMMNSCGDVYSNYHNFTVSLNNNNKPPPDTSHPVDNQKRLKVLHLSDIHIDPLYLEGSNADCDEPLCCQAGSGKPACELAKAGKWGDMRNCDIPERTLLNALDHINKTHPDIDYVILTGDMPPHDVWQQSKGGNLNVIRLVVENIFRTFPNKPVYHALGNHESSPLNMFSQPFESNGNWSNSYLYDTLDELWQKWLPSDTSKTIRYGAYYSTYVKPGLKIISVNMNYCYNLNFWLVLNSTDVAEQLQWLANELEDAEHKGDKVQIIGHIPPGSRDCIKKWSENYYKIINRYENTVTDQFFGHTHKDSFQVFYDIETYKRPTGIAYVAPSLTTYSDMNPGYRIYYVDGDHPDTTWRVLEHETWAMDLDKANKGAEPEWSKLYNTKEDYGINITSPQSWSHFINQMAEDTTLFQKFYTNHWKGANNGKTCKTPDCVFSVLCECRSGRSFYEDTLCQDLKMKILKSYVNVPAVLGLNKNG